jgi:7-cyano-7-deazaguanine reductase
MSYSDSSRLPLGKEIAYPQHYDPSVLFPIPRAENRAKLGLSPASALPFFGVDLWNAFELSWLNLKGKPQICLSRV